jgi:catechol 2,3-dioxygenase-like lactoylglutathione lyase family enzyme
MSTKDINTGAANGPGSEPLDLKLEVVVIPVADVDRAKGFYQGLGWRVDADFANGDDWRVVQLTPPGSPTSVMIGKGLTAAAAGSLQGTFLVVEDVAATRAELVARGAAVSQVFHFDGGLHVDGTHGRVAGADPQGRSYFSYASFSDPDGNSWLIQEVQNRLPGRGFDAGVAALTELLREAEQRHGLYEPTAPKHHWSGWYARYVAARQRGKTPDEAAAGAAAVSAVDIDRGEPVLG